MFLAAAIVSETAIAVSETAGGHIRLREVTSEISIVISERGRIEPFNAHMPCDNCRLGIPAGPTACDSGQIRTHHGQFMRAGVHVGTRTGQL